MIGRFIKYQQVDGFKQQLDHSQSAAFSTAKELHFLFRGLTTKHESTEQVIDFQSYIPCSHAVYRIIDAERLIKKLSLILGKIANLNIVSNLQLACIGNFTHDTFYKR